MSATWWLHNRYLTLFMIRELTSVFVAAYAVLLLIMVYRRRSGATAFHAFFEWLKTPQSIVLHLVILAFVIFHAVTWLNLTPKVVVVYRGEERVPAPLIAGAHYALWAVASAVVLWIALA